MKTNGVGMKLSRGAKLAVSAMLIAGVVLAGESSASARLATNDPITTPPLTRSQTAPMPAGWESVTLQLTPRDPKAVEQLSHAQGMGIASRRSALRSALASPAQQSKVAGYLRDHGLTITNVTPLAVSAMGPASVVQKLLPNARPVGTSTAAASVNSKRSAALKLPQALHGLVTVAMSSAFTGIHFKPLGTPHVLPSAAPNCTQCINGPRARQIYDVPATATTNDPGNIAIATLQFSGWDNSSLTDFASNYGLPDPVASGQYQAVAVDGADPTVALGGGDIEVALDQETLLHAAPTAHQVAYITQNSAQGEFDALNQIASDALSNAHGLHYTALSISWGLCESDALAGGTATVDAISSALAAVTAAGVTVFASAGDAGAFDCSTNAVPNNHEVVDYPASDPHVIGVGGLTTTGSTPDETVWWDPTASPGSTAFLGNGSGGGASNYFSQSTVPWQVAHLADAHRLVPDIALNGDPSTGEEVFLRNNTGSPPSQWEQVGGTSMSSPLAAAMLTDLEIAHGAATSYGLGNIAPNLYGAGSSAFRDITTGSNGSTHYFVTVGYDAVSGLGVPLWSQLEAALFGALSITAPTVTNNPVVPLSVTAPSGMQYTKYLAGVDAASAPSTCDSSNASAALPRTITLQGEGTYTIWVMGYTANGKCYLSQTSVWLDTTAPNAAMSTPTAAFATSSSIPITWAAADPNGSGVVTTDVQLARGPALVAPPTSFVAWRTGTIARSAVVTNAALASTYCFRSRARDAAGNVGAWSSPRCITTPTDERTLVASQGWQRGSTASYVAKTYSTTSALNSTLATKTSVSVRRVGLAAVKCPTCGTVGVYIGTTRVAVISLRQSATTRTFITLPAFATAKSGVVRFKVLTSGRLVRIDAALLSS